MPSQALVVDPSQVQSITVDPSAVQPMPQAQPEQPGFVTRAVNAFSQTGVGKTLSQTAQKFNIENVLHQIDDAADLARQGRLAEAWDTVSDYFLASPSQTILGNQQGTAFQEQRDYAKDTFDKLKGGDYSGAASNVLTAAMMNAHAAPAAVDALARVTETPRDVVATAAKGAAQGAVEANRRGLANPAHGAAVAAATLIPEIGHKIAAGIETANTLYGGVKGARQALAERAAQNAMDARVAAQRGAPGPTQAEQAGVTLAPTPQAPSPRVEPLAPDAAALAQQRTARQEVNARILADRKAAEAATSPTAGPSPELLDGIARAYLKKPYARLNAAEQVTVRLLASKVAAPSASEAAPAAPQVSGPAPVVSPQVAPVPPALPAAPPVPEATPAPAATPVATPSSPEAQALVPTAQSAVSPAATAPPAPAESPSQLTGRMLVIPSAKGTSHVPEGATEYYPGGGPAHVPTPGELGFGRYVPEGTAMDSSTLAHIQAENHKAYNAASFAYRQGIRDPSLLDDMTEPEKREFMNGSADQPGALQHGREVGNPTPKTKYQANRQTGSILDGNTLTLAKAHLQKMLDEEAPAPQELPSGGGPGPAALEAGQAVVKGNLLKSLKDVLSDETGSVGKGSGIDPETRKQLIEEASRLGAEVAEKVRRGVTTAKEAAGRVAQGVRQAVSPKTVSPAATEAVRNGVERSLNDYTRLTGEGEFHAAEAGRRGERELADRTRLTSDEKQIIQDAVAKVKPEEQRGLARSIEAQVRARKAPFPTKGDFAFQPFELNKIEFERDAAGNLKPQIEYKKIPYSFDAPVRGKKLWTGAQTGPKADFQLTPAGEKVSDAMAAKIVDEANAIRQKAREAYEAPPDQRDIDQRTAIKIEQQKEWYNAMRTLLRKTYGSAGDLLADLLGATSARQLVPQNLAQATEALERFTKGQYDDVLEPYRQHREAGGQQKEYTGPLALREGGKKYGMNTLHVMDALVGQFRGNRPGAPKTQTYAGNFIGATDRATIDMWAARQLQRIRHELYGDAPPVATPAETGVQGTIRPDYQTTGQFGFGQKVYEKAAEQLGMNHHELQAFEWFNEKDLWTRNNWTSALGEGGDMAAQLREKGLTRTLAGIAPQASSVPTNAIQMMRPAQQMAQADTNIASVVNTHALGLWEAPGGDKAGVPEYASNYELTVKPGPTSEQTINRQAAEVFKAAKKEDQDDAFVAKSIPDNEAKEHYARPGLSVYFKRPLDEKEAWALFEGVRTDNIGGVTVFGAPNVPVGKYAGMRFIYMPEYIKQIESQVKAGLGDAELTKLIKAGKKSAMRDITEIAQNIQGDSRVGHAMLEYFDVLAGHKGNYDSTIRSLTMAPGPGARDGGGPQAAATNDVSGSGPWRQRISTSVSERARSKLSAGANAPSGTGADGETGAQAVEPTPQETAAQTVERLRKKKRR